jgi:hypothetical protein
MVKVGFYDEKTLMELETFLEEIFSGIEEESYLIVSHPEGGGWVHLSDVAIGYLKTHNDHECTATPEDGCDFCYKLQLLHILPDGEYNPESEN